MTRKYELKRRAERQEETRRRIVEAAIELHRTKGPARTTLSDIARLAGVQRHTLYRHFPDERAIGHACSGLYFETHLPPDPAAWHAIADPAGRLRTGLCALYEWYEQVGDMFACVLRDAEVHPLTWELFELRGKEPMAAIRAPLAGVLPRRKAARATLDLALDFRCWQRLRAAGLSNREAAETMVRAIDCQ
jgi:AcrR family transcriptional regulator